MVQSAQWSLQAGHLTSIRPLVSLRSFSPHRLFDAKTPFHRARDRENGRHKLCAQAPSDTDPEMIREIARLMPDPGGTDDLLASDSSHSADRGDNGWSRPGGPSGATDLRMQDAYNDLLAGSDFLDSSSPAPGQLSEFDINFEERLAQLPPERQRQELQRIRDQEAREEWEVEQAQEKALELHHAQMSGTESRYEMTMRIADIMEELETHDYYAGDDQDRIPSWIRAHFILEQEEENRRMTQAPPPEPVQAGENQSLGRSILPGADIDLGMDFALESLVGSAAEMPDYSAAAEFAAVEGGAGDGSQAKVSMEDEDDTEKEDEDYSILDNREEPLEKWSDRQLKQKFSSSNDEDLGGDEDEVFAVDAAEAEEALGPGVLAELEDFARREAALQEAKRTAPATAPSAEEPVADNGG